MRSSFPARGHSRIRSARVAKVWSSTDAKRNGNRGSFERALDEIQKSTAIFFSFFLRYIHRQRDVLSINRNEMKLHRNRYAIDMTERERNKEAKKIHLFFSKLLR